MSVANIVLYKHVKQLSSKATICCVYHE